MRPATAERIAQLLQRRRQKQWEEDHRPPRGHRFEGRVFLGYLLAIEVFDKSPRDGTNTWLVWNLKTDAAELWRSCDPSRILRADGKVKQNKCRYNSYWSKGPSAKENWFELMYLAKRRLDGLRLGETEEEFWDKVPSGGLDLTEDQKMEIYG
jgi:hypothetical protein